MSGEPQLLEHKRKILREFWETEEKRLKQESEAASHLDVSLQSIKESTDQSLSEVNKLLEKAHSARETAAEELAKADLSNLLQQKIIEEEDYSQGLDPLKSLEHSANVASTLAYLKGSVSRLLRYREETEAEKKRRNILLRRTVFFGLLIAGCFTIIIIIMSELGTPISLLPQQLSAIPTASPTSGTETATVTGQSPELEDLSFIVSELASGAVDAWTVDIASSAAVTITVAPELDADIIFTVMDSDGQILVNSRDQASAGGVETIRDLDVANAAAIEIQVSTDPARETDYALMVMDETSYSFSFQDTLDFDSQRSGTLEENTDHFWFFNAADGDKIDLQITPDSDADAYVELFTPDGLPIEILDDEYTGVAESLDNYSLPKAGLYSIRIGEYDYGPMNYQIFITES